MDLGKSAITPKAEDMLTPWLQDEAASPAGNAVASRVVPFVVFMAFIALDEVARFLMVNRHLSLPPQSLYYLYPIKAGSVALLLWIYRKEYRELVLADLKGTRCLAVAFVGIATFVLWISMDWAVTVAGAPAGFDPALLPAGPIRMAVTASRIFGAVLVVPLMEELFWRSFLLRYLIAPNFQSVPVGQFTWSSFLIGALLFGLEHHFFLAGVTAGMIYSVVLYRTRSLAHCVLAHAVTNLALACYVLSTGRWYFW